MRKPATWIVQSLFYLNPKFQASIIFCGCTAQFMSDLVRNPEDRFSHNETQTLFANTKDKDNTETDINNKQREGTSQQNYRNDIKFSDR